ncbi:hypothetical protein, partial [Dermacoccus nishinomiyaensis]|uniref:hypothetical protein n=1 Tax=Dermacoccus nishinomiyaensis TaxID=1274 RepID=UPI0011A7C0B2
MREEVMVKMVSGEGEIVIGRGKRIGRDVWNMVEEIVEGEEGMMEGILMSIDVGRVDKGRGQWEGEGFG